MQIVPFEAERLLSVWQNQVQYDFTESGVHPIHLRDLITREEYNGLFEEIQLRYIQTNGPLPLKEAICRLYDEVHPDNILVTSYLIWKIAEPQKYLESVKNDVEAKRLLRDRLRNVQNVEIGQHYFSEFVNSDKEKIHLSAIEKNMHNDIKQQALEDLQKLLCY